MRGSGLAGQGARPVQPVHKRARYVPLKYELKKMMAEWKLTRGQIIKLAKRIRVMREANRVRLCVSQVLSIEPFEFLLLCSAAIALEYPQF